MKTERRKLYILIIIFLFSLPSLFAQQSPAEGNNEYTDEELETFVDAAIEIMPLQEEAQMRMVEEIQQHDLSVERFNSILEARTTGQDHDASGDEVEAFEEALRSVEEIQLEYQQKIEAEIENAGMSPERFEEILARYQQDPELHMRINEIIEGRS